MKLTGHTGLGRAVTPSEETKPPVPGGSSSRPGSPGLAGSPARTQTAADVASRARQSLGRLAKLMTKQRKPALNASEQEGLNALIEAAVPVGQAMGRAVNQARKRRAAEKAAQRLERSDVEINLLSPPGAFAGEPKAELFHGRALLAFARRPSAMTLYSAWVGSGVHPEDAYTHLQPTGERAAKKHLRMMGAPAATKPATRKERASASFYGFRASVGLDMESQVAYGALIRQGKSPKQAFRAARQLSRDREASQAADLRHGEARVSLRATALSRPPAAGAQATGQPAAAEPLRTEQDDVLTDWNIPT